MSAWKKIEGDYVRYGLHDCPEPPPPGPPLPKWAGRRLLSSVFLFPPILNPKPDEGFMNAEQIWDRAIDAVCRIGAVAQLADMVSDASQAARLTEAWEGILIHDRDCDWQVRRGRCSCGLHGRKEATPRFFIDHGMIHDRVSGRHVTTNPDEDTWAGMTITETCALLNQLARG